jgi:hypothetical protein
MIIATKTSVYQLENNGEKLPNLVKENLDIRRVEEGNEVDIVSLSNGKLLLFRDEKQKKIETGIKDRIDSLCVIEENPLILLVGCTPPNLYRVKEREGTEKVKTFNELTVRDQWYTPWGGPPAVRSMAKTNDGWVYADIHVGSIMRSPDKGKTWEPVNPSLHKDVHEVTTTPNSNNKVYANTYLSVYISDDKGQSWEHRSKGLNNRYGRGIAVNLKDPKILLCGVSDGPTGANVHGQLYYTENAGKNWSHVTEGFPKSTNNNIDTFHIAYSSGKTAWVTDNNNLYRSTNKGKTWQLFWEAPEDILMISTNKNFHA